jgi:hypothetical protein
MLYLLEYITGGYMSNSREYKIHPNEVFLTTMAPEQLQLFQFEVETYDNSKPYLAALKEQLSRLEIKL